MPEEMGPDEWIKILARKVYRQFHTLPGSYLEVEDFEMVGLMAVAMKLRDNTDTSPKLLTTIAYRRMIDYGRRCADVRDHDFAAKECRGLKALCSFEESEYQIYVQHSPLIEAMRSEVRSWIDSDRFGLTPREVVALKMRFWADATYLEIVETTRVASLHPGVGWDLVHSALQKLRLGLMEDNLHIDRNLFALILHM